MVIDGIDGLDNVWYSESTAAALAARIFFLGAQS